MIVLLKRLNVWQCLHVMASAFLPRKDQQLRCRPLHHSAVTQAKKCVLFKLKKRYIEKKEKILKENSTSKFRQYHIEPAQSVTRGKVMMNSLAYCTIVPNPMLFFRSTCGEIMNVLWRRNDLHVFAADGKHCAAKRSNRPNESVAIAYQN